MSKSSLNLVKPSVNKIFKQIRFPQIILLLGVFIYCMPLYSQGPDFGWANKIDGNSDIKSVSVAVDDSENVFTSGNFQGTAYFGNDTLTSTGKRDAFISKQDAQGNFLWAKRMGSRGDDYGYSIAVDDSGNVYCAGSFGGVADFGPFTLTMTGGLDAFICKLDAQGNFIWAKQFGGTASNTYVAGRSIALDKSGNVFTTGRLQNGTADFDPGTSVYPLTASNGTGMFISKLDNNGNFIWAKEIGGNSGEGDVWARSITVDNSGNIFTTGEFFHSSDFDPGINVADTFYLTSNRTSNANAFVCKLDAQGSFIWAKKLGGNSSSGNDRGWSIETDSAGNAYTIGFFFRQAQFGSFTLKASNSVFNIFVCKQDIQGNVLWAHSIYGFNNLDADHSIAVDKGGSVYITGAFKNTSNFGSITLTAAKSSTFISKLNTQGTFLWAEQIGGTKTNSQALGRAIAIGACGNIYTTGIFAGQIDLDPGTNQKDTFFLQPIFPYAFGVYKSYIQKMIEPSSSGSVIVGSNSPLCSGDTLKLNASNSSSYSWTGPNGFGSSQQNPTIPNVDSNASGTYSVITCNDTASIKVTVNPSPKVTASTNSPVCVGDTITLFSSGGNSSSWTGPNGFISNSKDTLIYPAGANESGIYRVTVTDNNGCSDTASVNVVVNTNLPIATASSNSPLCEGDSLQLNASGGDSYNWTGPNNYSSTQQNPIIANANPSMTGDYIVTVSVNNGCRDVNDTVHVTVNSKLSDACHSYFVIPNIFTPNGDGKNDLFKIAGLSSYPGTKVLILDRWGREVYKNNDYQNDWDGDDLTDGNYLYIITVNDKAQTVYKGNLTILSSEE